MANICKSIGQQDLITFELFYSALEGGKVELLLYTYVQCDLTGFVPKLYTGLAKCFLPANIVDLEQCNCTYCDKAHTLMWDLGQN